MLRSVFPVATALALAVFAPLVAPGPAMAQQQGSWYSGTDGYGRSTSGWSSGYGGGSSYRGSTYYSTPTYYASPPLDPDTDYFYRVTVRWQEGGQDVTRTRKVEVHASDRLNITFGPSVAETARR
jgi:uncharacterized protein (TIGR03000 family)